LKLVIDIVMCRGVSIDGVLIGYLVY
jgi:hypothetical protein